MPDTPVQNYSNHQIFDKQLIVAFLSMLAAFVFAIVSIFIAMSILGPIRSSMTMNLEPVSSMVFGLIFLGQALTGPQIVGAALVIVAVLTVQRAKRPASAPAKGGPP